VGTAADPTDGAGRPRAHLNRRVPAVADALAPLREAVTRYLTDECGIAHRACSNVVRHAYRQPGGTIDVTAECADGHIGIRVQDTGRGHPSGHQPGLGLRLIHAVTSSVDIRVSDGGTQIATTFACRPSPPARR
jgi:hypothetical protein